MDASQYKDYVLFMLFIKYVSDKYADYDGFEPPIAIPPGAGFKDMVALKGNADIGNKINTLVIQPLIDANTRLARSDFPDFNDPNKLGDGQKRIETLGNLIAIFENPALDFAQNRAEHDDILGDAYEYLMRHFASESGKSKGQFYTPCKMNETEYKPFDEQRVLAKTEKSCPTTLRSESYAEESDKEDEEVSWADWAFDSHQLPSFHFIDLLELLGIG